MFLSALATLNFSLAFLIGLLSTPLTYVQPIPGRPITATALGLSLSIFAPTTVMLAGTYLWKLKIEDVLTEAAYGWNVWGMNTHIVVWCVWWPAWLVGASLLYGKPQDETPRSEDDGSDKKPTS